MYCKILRINYIIHIFADKHGIQTAIYKTLKHLFSNLIILKLFRIHTEMAFYFRM